MLELLGNALLNIMQWKYLLPLFLGTLMGVIGGAIPGVTITLTVIILLPFTFGLDPLQGLAAMTGVYVGGSAGGLITASLMGIPGTPSAIATTFDGFPMARAGEPGRAVWLGIWASCFGGLIGGLFLVLVTGPLAAIALQFGPWEYFSLFILALAMVAKLAESSMTKGLISAGIGLVIAMFGNDPVGGIPRFTFGSDFLSGGFPFLPVLIGIFAFSQIMTDVENLGRSPAARSSTQVKGSLRVSQLKVIGEIISRPL